MYMHTSFFFNDTATTEIYTLSLHDALPICARHRAEPGAAAGAPPAAALPAEPVPPPSDGDADDRALAARRGGPVERDSGGGRGDARHPADVGPGRIGDLGRDRPLLPRGRRTDGWRDRPLAADQRLSPRHPGRPQGTAGQ